MDESNVNNLNGVPNFGHGLEQEAPVEVAESVAAEPEAAPEVAPEVEIISPNE